MAAERRYTLNCGPLYWSGCAIDWEHKAFVCAWMRDTILDNIIWIRLWSFRLDWRPVRTIGAFTDRLVEVKE